MRRNSIISTAVAITLSAGSNAFADVPTPSFAKDGKLVVCTSPANPPMTYMEADAAPDARPVGMDIEISDALGKLWNAETSYSASAFAGLLTSLASGRCGMLIGALYMNPKREANFDMSVYFPASTVIVAAGENSDIKSPDDLSGKSVTIEAGTALYEDAVNKLNAKFAEQGRPLAKLSSYPSQAAAAEQVILGRADANISDLIEATMREKQTEGKVKVAYAYPSDNVFAIYTAKNADNAAAVRAGLKQLCKEGFFAKMASKYNLKEEGFSVVEKY